jgi:adenylylsulfate reductase subunit A
MDYPETDPKLDCFVESRQEPETGEIKMFTRPYEQIIPGDRTKP